MPIAVCQIFFPRAAASDWLQTLSLYPVKIGFRGCIREICLVRLLANQFWQTNMKFVDGTEVLADCANELEINLASLIAATSFWAHPSRVSDPVFPNTRRARHGEKRGTIDALGAKLDDNGAANRAIKQVLRSAGKFKNFFACHIWEKTCYDIRYHTLPANLVLLPSDLSSLSDHNDHIKACLKYRAWELYDWKPEGSEKPQRPKNYPSNWRSPAPLSIFTPDRVNSRSNQATRSQTALPIFFQPESSDEFKAALIKQRKALIDIYANGTVKTIPWCIKRFDKNSNLIGNLRSRKDFRNPHWKNLGISKVVLRIDYEGETL